MLRSSKRRAKVSVSDAPAGAAEGSGGGRGAAAGSSSTGDAAGSSSTAIVPATPLRPVSEADKRQSIDDAMSLFGKNRVGVAEEEEAAQKAAEDCISKFVYGVRRGADEEEKLAACMELAKYVNNAFGYEASKLGSHLRFTKGLAFILQLLYEGQAPIQRIGLMVLSNLCSDAFDPLSNLTKKQVLNAQIFERIKDFVYSGDQVAQTYAVACLQNLCKEIAFAKLLRSYELTEELERLVTVSPNPHLRKFAAGALFNAVEAVHKEFVSNSRDTAEGAEAMKKKGLLASFMGAEVEPEIELSEEVLEELAKREASLSEERRQREEAALVIQGLMRQKRTRRAFRMLMALAKAVSLVARWVRRRRKRKLRWAALFVQSHFRAYVCHKRGICHHKTILLIINTTRYAHYKAIIRMVDRRMALYNLEKKRREAEQLVTKYDARKKKYSKMSGRAASRSPSKRPESAKPKEKEPSKRMGRFSRNTSVLGARGQSFVSGLLPKGTTLPKAAAITSRIPLFPSKAPTSSKAAAAAAQAAAQQGRLPPPGGGAARMRPPLALSSYATGGSHGVGSLGSLTSNASLNSVQSDQGGVLSSALMSMAAQGIHGQPRTPSRDRTPPRVLGMLGSTSEDVERRRSAAAAAKAVLTLSEIDGVDGAAPSRRSLPPDLNPGSAARRFPPGSASLAKFNSYQNAVGGSEGRLTGAPSYGTLPQLPRVSTPGGMMIGQSPPQAAGGGMAGMVSLSGSTSMAVLPSYRKTSVPNPSHSAAAAAGLRFNPDAGPASSSGGGMTSSSTIAALPTLSQTQMGKQPAARQMRPSSSSKYLAAGPGLFSSPSKDTLVLSEEGSSGLMRPPGMKPGPHNV